MAEPDVQELKDRAAKLRSLADHLQKLTNDVHDAAAGMEWSGPLTDRVRGDIKTWRTRCGTVADRIRAEADHLVKQAESQTGTKR